MNCLKVNSVVWKSDILDTKYSAVVIAEFQMLHWSHWNYKLYDTVIDLQKCPNAQKKSEKVSHLRATVLTLEWKLIEVYRW